MNVLLNIGAGWGYEMTPAELTRKDEFYSIYWSEYNFVKENGSSELREMPDYLDQDRPSFEENYLIIWRKDQFLRRKPNDNNAIQIKRSIDICRLVLTIL